MGYEQLTSQPAKNPRACSKCRSTATRDTRPISPLGWWAVNRSVLGGGSDEYPPPTRLALTSQVCARYLQ